MIVPSSWIHPGAPLAVYPPGMSLAESPQKSGPYAFIPFGLSIQYCRLPCAAFRLSTA